MNYDQWTSHSYIMILKAKCMQTNVWLIYALNEIIDRQS